MTGGIALPSPGESCESGTIVLPGVQLFHDAGAHPPVFAGQTGGALRFRTGATDAGYVSFVAELQSDQTAQFRVGVFLIIDLDISAEPARPVYIRAYFANEGGDTELNDLIVLKECPRTVRFNLDGLRIPLDVRTDVWVHVILADPANVELSLRRFEVSVVEQ